MRALTALLALTAAPAMAAGNLSLKSDVFVERTEVRDGKMLVTLAEPKMVTPGDRLVFVLHYRNEGQSPASNMVVTNPMPSAVSYQDAEGAQVSVDGGRTWGPLAAARIRRLIVWVKRATTFGPFNLFWLSLQILQARWEVNAGGVRG